MKKHTLSDDLSSRLTRCESHAITWTGVAFRSAAVKYANQQDLLTGQGAKKAGARWNPPGSTATIYVSLELETAVQEALAHFRYHGFPVEQALPRVLVSIEVSLRKVLNLANGKIRRVMGVTRRELLSEDWRTLNQRGEESLTQTIGRLSWQSGWEGLLAPSAAHPGGVNLVIFRDNLAELESLKIINSDQLPAPP